MCQRYGVLPSQLLKEDASVLRIFKIASIVENLRNNGK